MSSETVQKVIRQAVQSAEFRGLLLNHPHQALAGLELSAAEIAQLKGLSADSLDTLAMDLEQRVSRVQPTGFNEFTHG